MDDVSATTVTLIGLGTVSIGSLVLLQVQAIKALWPRLEGQLALCVVFVVSAISTLIAMDEFGVTWRDRSTLFAAYFSTVSVFISAIAQYALLFKVRVRNMPPSPDAEVIPAATIEPTRDLTDVEYQAVTQTLPGRMPR